MAHRRELLEQIRGTMGYFGIDMEKNLIVVESIQKLASDDRSQDFSLFTFNFSLIIIDEAHHALAKTYRNAVEALATGEVPWADGDTLQAGQ